MIIEIVLIAVIIVLLLWIILTSGGSLQTKDLREKIERLEKKNQALNETNEMLRSEKSLTSEGLYRPVIRLENLVNDFEHVKEAFKGSRSAKQIINAKYNEEIGPDLIKKILQSEEMVDETLKRRTAHEVLIGDIGKDILEGLNENRSLEDSVADAGVPLSVGRERLRILKELGYVDYKLNLRPRGREALKLMNKR